MSPLEGGVIGQPLGPELLLVCTIMFLGPWMVDLVDFWLFPATWRSGPATWILLTSLFIGLLPNGADLIGFSKVSLIGRNVLYATMTMLTIVPIHKAIHPTTHGI